MIRVKPIQVVLAGYLAILAVFAFRPFYSISGRYYEEGHMEVEPGAVVLHKGTAIEERRSTGKLIRKLKASDRLSIAVSLQTYSDHQEGPARLLTLSRSAMERNFTLGQDGKDAVFRLQTSLNRHKSHYQYLRAPNVFDREKVQHLVVTYDGLYTRLFVDGISVVEPYGLAGDFSIWGRNHALVLGDEPTGGRPWRGRIHRFALFDRALGESDAAEWSRGASILDPVIEYDFRAMNGKKVRRIGGLYPLKYRNLFISTDPTVFMAQDMFLNIVAFIPLSALVYFNLPVTLRLKKREAILIYPAVIGFVVSAAFEYFQRGIEGRVPCLADLFYNSTGTLIGCALLYVVMKIGNTVLLLDQENHL